VASAPCDKKLVVEEDIVYGFVFVFGGVAYFARNVLKSLGFRFVSDSKKWRTESGVKAEEIADLVATGVERETCGGEALHCVLRERRSQRVRGYLQSGLQS